MKIHLSIVDLLGTSLDKDSLLGQVSFMQYLYIIRCLLFKYRLIFFLRGLKVSDESLGESNTERCVKVSAGISKEST